MIIADLAVRLLQLKTKPFDIGPNDPPLPLNQLVQRLADRGFASEAINFPVEKTPALLEVARLHAAGKAVKPCFYAFHGLFSLLAS